MILTRNQIVAFYLQLQIMHKIFILFCFVTLSFCLSYDPNMLYRYHSQINSQPQLSQLMYFDQLLDHYDYYNKVTWRQRYWINDTYFNLNTGPILLYICGQWVCGGPTQAIVDLAKTTGGLAIGLEHRYYGESMPYTSGSLDLQNLKHLSTEQALSDIAYFIVQYKRNPNVAKNPWIVFGGSYPGAMVAWFRYKYPHLTIGSISSSGVVNPIQQYWEYDQVVHQATARSGLECAASVKAINDRAEAQVYGAKSTEFKRRFNAENLSNQQFLYFWADIFAGYVQSGKRTALCSKLQGLSLEDQFNLMVQEGLKGDPRGYGALNLLNPTYYNADGKTSRAWNYQVCTQFGWFQTNCHETSARSAKVDNDFFRSWCEQVYGVTPRISRSHTQYGGVDLDVNNLIMVNGIEDPWKRASVKQLKNGSQIISLLADCQDCSHCIDLRAYSSTQPTQLTHIRNFKISQIFRWVTQYWNKQT